MMAQLDARGKLHPCKSITVAEVMFDLDGPIPNFHLLPVSPLEPTTNKAYSVALLMNFPALPFGKEHRCNKYPLRPDQWSGPGRN